MEAKPKLLDRVRDKIRTKRYSYRTEQQYVGWIRRYIRFHGTRHPAELSAPHVERLLTHLAIEEKVSCSTSSTNSFTSSHSCSTAAAFV